MLCLSDRNIAAAFLAKLRTVLPAAQVVVFGSRARGDAHPDSDLDLLVVVDCVDPSVRRAVNEAAWEVGFPDVVVAPVVVTREAIEAGPLRHSTFIQTVLLEGVAL
jgi:predicted nucleotidyltransferase